MVLAVVRHAESIENADKYRGFYHDRRPYPGAVAHVISRSVVGLTPAGFRQSLWLAEALSDLTGPRLRVYTSTYRRSIDTAVIAFDGLPEIQLNQTALLDEQHYGDATYMTKQELFAAYPDSVGDRVERKHLWVPPGGGESLAEGVSRRAGQFLALARADIQAGRHVVAITHHTTLRRPRPGRHSTADIRDVVPATVVVEGEKRGPGRTAPTAAEALPPRPLGHDCRAGSRYRAHTAPADPRR